MMAEELTWTTEKPTVPGFYYWRSNEEGLTEIVKVKKGEATKPAYWQATMSRGWQQFVGLMHGEWNGPLKISDGQAQTIRQSFKGR